MDRQDNSTQEFEDEENNWRIPTIIAIVSLLVFCLVICVVILLARRLADLRKTLIPHFWHHRKNSQIKCAGSEAKNSRLQLALDCMPGHLQSKQIEGPNQPFPVTVVSVQPRNDDMNHDLKTTSHPTRLVGAKDHERLSGSQEETKSAADRQRRTEQSYQHLGEPSIIITEDNDEASGRETETESRNQHFEKSDLRSMKHLSRSIATLTATGLHRLRTMTISSTQSSGSMLDLSDVSSTGDDGSEHASTSSAISLAAETITVDLNLSYVSSEHSLLVRASEIRGVSPRSNNIQLRILLTPERKQRYRSKHYPVSEGKIQLLESFFLAKIKPGELGLTGLRFRLYSCEVLKREKLLGEVHVSLGTLDLDLQREQQLLVELEAPRKHALSLHNAAKKNSLGRDDSSFSGASRAAVVGKQLPALSAEENRRVLLGLAYNKNTGRLLVEIIELLSPLHNIYVKVDLLSHTGQHLGREKTNTKTKSVPTVSATFMFQVLHFQIAYVTVKLSLVQKRNLKRKETVGYLCAGYDNSSEETADHWREMREADAQQVCRWHLFRN